VVLSQKRKKGTCQNICNAQKDKRVSDDRGSYLASGICLFEK
jgi:hypothetical protein